MGWFPGYAIDLETGERLNVIFSEDSWLAGENGRDMIWNPTSNIVTEEFPFYSTNYWRIFRRKLFVRWVNILCM